MTTTLTKSRAIEKPRFRARFNWPLIIGAFLVGMVIYLAIVGPEIAPYDPLAENLLIKDENTGEWHIPPFPAFEVTGYPLGSDEFGRDLYSRLLWAIRPTLQMVAIVAAVRLVLGTLIGLVAGWSTGRVGRFFDSLISGALALPGLLVALGTIAVVGVELGLIAFVIGLSVTGWAEAARIVREQTRVIKSQVYIEAANAMGASDIQIIGRHVVRQIQAMLLMLLAFEIGSTLMLTAGLGFLGYYIGGDVWVDVADFVARRTSGAPELGQMLATAWVRLTDPWGLVSVGSVVFVAVLGFNLIGEGLRLRLNQEVQGGVLKWLGERAAGTLLWVEHYITYPIGKLMERPVPFSLFRLALGIAVGAAAMFGWDQGWFKLPEADVSFLYGDSPTLTPLPEQSSAQSATPTPQTQVISTDPVETPPPPEPAVAWTFETGSIFTGAPVIARDGTVYATTSDSLLHAFAPDGSVKWQFALPARPVESPALSPEGIVYVTDADGALNAISASGEGVWRYTMEPARSATTGPVIDSNGNIYYASGSQAGMVQAVSPSGEGLWLGQGETFSYHKVPQVSSDGALVFLWDDTFNAADGSLLELEFPIAVDRFLVGRDRKTYFRAGHNLVEWQLPNGAPEILQNITWSYTEYFDEGILPQEAGVTENQVSWELYTTEFGGNTSVFWIEVVDGEGRLVGVADAPLSQGRMIYMDDETLLAVVCGLGNFRFQGPGEPKPECHAIYPEAAEPDWMIQVAQNGILVGAAYQPVTEMLYITTEEGRLHAVEVAPTPAENGGITFELPTTPVEITDPAIAWEYRPEGGFAGPPISTSDGTIYVAALGGKIVALKQDSTLFWETALDPAPGAGPELSPEGTLFVPDVNGGLSAVDAQGGLLWHFVQPIPGLSPASKPVITSNGIIYYAITDKSFGYIQAVSSTGEGIWLSETATTTKFYQTPGVSAAGDLVFLAENVFDAADGRLLALSSPPDLPVQPQEFVTGQNGKNYIREGNTLYEWQRNGDQIEILSTIEWQFRAENADNPTFSISAPVKIQVAPNGNITLWYRFNIVWLTETGESLGVATTTVANDQTIAAIYSESESRTITCGITLNPIDPSSEQCMGFQLGEERPLWRIAFGSSTAVIENVFDIARTPAGFAFASKKGVLYGVMEQSIADAWEAAKSLPAPLTETEGNGTISTGNGWTYNAPEPFMDAPILGRDGSVYLLSESQTLYTLSHDGRLQSSFPLPTPTYIVQDTGFGGGYYPMLPEIMGDGAILVVSDGRVYALNPDGSLRWEFPIERPPFSFPTEDEPSGVWYFIDDLGTLYAFSPTEGLLWTHDLAEGLRAASPWPVFGLDGKIFYTITNGGTGMIEALNPDGSFAWRVDLTTYSFYNPIEITPDGNWLMVDDNMIHTTSNRLLETDNLEFQVEEFTIGHDGKNYLMAGSSIMEWEVGANGISVLSQVTVAFPPNRQTGVAPELSVSEDGLYWIRLFAGFGARQINMWVNAEGEVLGLVEVNANFERMIDMDEENSRLTVCSSNTDENRLECRGYDGRSNTPIWQLNIEGLANLNDYFYYEGRLYVLVDQDSIQVVEVELP